MLAHRPLELPAPAWDADIGIEALNHRADDEFEPPRRMAGPRHGVELIEAASESHPVA